MYFFSYLFMYVLSSLFLYVFRCCLSYSVMQVCLSLITVSQGRSFISLFLSFFMYVLRQFVRQFSIYVGSLSRCLVMSLVIYSWSYFFIYDCMYCVLTVISSSSFVRCLMDLVVSVVHQFFTVLLQFVIYGCIVLFLYFFSSLCMYVFVWFCHSFFIYVCAASVPKGFLSLCMVPFCLYAYRYVVFMQFVRQFSIYVGSLSRCLVMSLVIYSWSYFFMSSVMYFVRGLLRSLFIELFIYFVRSVFLSLVIQLLLYFIVLFAFIQFVLSLLRF